MCKMKMKIRFFQGKCIRSCGIINFLNSVWGDQPYHVAKDKASGTGLDILSVEKCYYFKT